MNAELPDSELRRQTYYAEAASWAGDARGAMRASTRAAWTVAAAAAAVAALEAVALVGLTPLKTVVPYTILVDRNTGYVEMARGVKPGPLTQDAALINANLAQYVRSRETFDAADLKENYRQVQLLSAGEARAQYLAAMAPANPQSPVKIYPSTTVVQTVIKSVSMLNATTGLVRFDTVRRDAGAAVGELHPFSAVISFRYTGAPMRNGDRFLNPLGFQVTRYRRDMDAAGAETIPVDLRGLQATPPGREALQP